MTSNADNFWGTIEQLKTEWAMLIKKPSPPRFPIREIFWGTPYVIFSTKTGPLAFEDRCPHRGYPLSRGTLLSKKDDTEIRCHYHGWRFDTKGCLTTVPGIEKPIPRCHLTGLQLAQTRFGLWGRQGRDVPKSLPPWLLDLNENAHPFFILQTLVHGRPEMVLDNFLDPFHTHFLHAPFLRHDKNRKPVRVQRTFDEHLKQLEVAYLDEPTPKGLVSRLFEGRRTKTIGRYLFPWTAQVEYWGAHGLDLRMTLTMTPNVEKTFHVYLVVEPRRFRLPLWGKRIIFLPFLRKLIDQDLTALNLLWEQERYFPNQRPISCQQDLAYTIIRDLLLDRGRPSFKDTVNIHI